MTPLEILGLVALFTIAIIIVPLAIGLLVTEFYGFAKWWYNLGRGLRKKRKVSK